MRMNRRQTLRFLTSAGAAAVLPSTSGCASMRSHFGFAPRNGRAALLLPMSGEAADVGRSMARAAAMAQPQTARRELTVLDTAGSPEGAERAVADAIRSGARLILGPVFSYEVEAVADALPEDAALVTFANDPAVARYGAFRLGVTPAHSVPPILRYARGQGVRRVAVIAEEGPWGAQSIEAARAAAPALGFEVTGAIVVDGPVERADLAAELTAGDAQPDAVLITDGGPALISVAETADALGLQILGTIQWAARDFSGVEALHDAWFTAPDPTRWTAFATAYQNLHGAPPGVLTGLAYDAAAMARTLSTTGSADREGVMAQSRFSGVVGDFGFRADGSSVRDLVVLAIGPGGVRVIAQARAA